MKELLRTLESPANLPRQRPVRSYRSCAPPPTPGSTPPTFCSTRQFLFSAKRLSLLPCSVLQNSEASKPLLDHLPPSRQPFKSSIKVESMLRSSAVTDIQMLLIRPLIVALFLTVRIDFYPKKFVQTFFGASSSNLAPVSHPLPQPKFKPIPMSSPPATIRAQLPVEISEPSMVRRVTPCAPPSTSRDGTPAGTVLDSQPSTQNDSQPVLDFITLHSALCIGMPSASPTAAGPSSGPGPIPDSAAKAQYFSANVQ